MLSPVYLPEPYSMKYLILMLLALAGWWIWRRLKGRPPAPPSRLPPGEEAMVACSHCGVYGPVSDMLRDGEGQHYCSEAHRRLGPG